LDSNDIEKKIGYRDSSGVGLSGEVVEGEVKFLETGTKLSFRPYIGNDGYVRMDIFPKDSTGTLNADYLCRSSAVERRHFGEN
jgi:hypothetical protein